MFLRSPSARQWLALAWLFWFEALLALYSSWSSPGLRYGPEGPLRGEMSRSSSFLAVACAKDWYCWLFTPFPSVVAGPDARHHGRYVLEGLLRGWLVLQGTMHLALYSLFLSSGPLSILAGSERQFCGVFILFKAVDIPVVVQRSFLMVLLFRRPRDSAVALGQDGRCPCRRVLRVPQVQVVMMTVVISQLHLVDVQMVTQTSESLGTRRGSSSSS